MRRVEDITQALWGTRVSASTVSDLNQKIYGKIEGGASSRWWAGFPTFFLDGLWLKRSWGGEVKNDLGAGSDRGLADRVSRGPRGGRGREGRPGEAGRTSCAR